MIKSGGIIKVEFGKRVALELDDDFIKYYNWFITRKYWIKIPTPLHMAHISICNDKIKHQCDWSRAVEYDNQFIQFEYDPHLIEGGFTKGFIMFYLKVQSPQIDLIKKDINIIESETYRGLHITVATGKSLIKSWWPEMIKI